jgi:aryl-alcohol dehydrogenase-like predicted oxidoreductase
MKYNDFGKTGLKVSAIAYGGIVSTMNDFNHYTFEGDQQGASDGYVQFALESGVNYFDVAPTYGDAQEKLGNSLRGSRDKIFLACKTNRRDYDSAAREAEESLKLLHTDHFDNYQLHGLSSIAETERAFESDGVMRLVEELRRSGTAKHVGITAHSEKAAILAINSYDFETVLFPFNWQMNLATGYGNELMPLAKSKGMGILGMKSMIERGFRGADDPARKRWPKSWCKPFDLVEQRDLLIAAMKYSRSLGVNTLIPAGDIEHFRFAVENADEIWGEPITEAQRALLDRLLPEVRNDLFMHTPD